MYCGQRSEPSSISTCQLDIGVAAQAAAKRGVGGGIEAEDRR